MNLERETLEIIVGQLDLRLVFARICESQEDNTLKLKFLNVTIFVDAATNSLVNFDNCVLSKWIVVFHSFLLFVDLFGLLLLDDLLLFKLLHEVVFLDLRLSQLHTFLWSLLLSTLHFLLLNHLLESVFWL